MKKKFIILGSVLLVAIVAIILVFIPIEKVDSNEKIIQNYLENKDKEYSDEEKTEIVTAYKTLLDEQGEEYVDNIFTREEQTELTYLGMTVNVYVFRDFKNYGYLNSDNSFIDVSDFNTIAGFDVDAALGADGFADIAHVEIIIDGEVYATADLTEEMASFLQRLQAQKEADGSVTIFGVDSVDVDENTRLYITYIDAQYDDSFNVTSLRVSGHLAMK